MRGKLLGGRYRIQNRIGEGGMAFVYVAIDEKLGRKVAIKILHNHMAENEDLRKRFYMEARSISTLDHPNILKIYDFSGEHSDDLWIVTEILKGLNLNDYASTFPGKWLHPIVAACIVREILKALEKAHQQEIIHRDIKPENIMMLDNGRVKLMDFGIAKNMQGHSMTLTGTFMGSPSYMSPEQVRGKFVDHRSDVYSLGVLFYEIITGKLPYVGNSTHDVIVKICDGVFKQPKEFVPNLPRDLNSIILKSMAKHPSNRYKSAASFAKDIEIFIGRHGFAESHIELERYFSDREKFDRRLRKLAFTNKAPQNKKQKKEPKAAEPPRTTKTLPTMKLPPNYQAKDLRAHNERALDQAVAKAQTPELVRPAAVGDAPRRDHAIPRQHLRPSISRQTRLSRHRPHTPAGSGGQNARARRVPRVPKRHARGRDVQITHYKNAQRLSYLMGACLVALIGGLAIWGFWTIQNRIPHKTLPKAKVVAPTKKAPKTPKRASKPASTATKKANQPTRPAARNAAPKKSKRPKQATVKPRDPRELKERPKKDQRSPKASRRPSPKKAVKRPVVAPPTKTQASAGKARLQVSSRPAAQVFIDGRRVGTTTDRTTSSGLLSVSAGRHRIELRRPGFQSHKMTLRLRGGQVKKLGTIILQPDSNSRLTLTVNKSPVRVSLKNQDTAQTQSFVMRGRSQTKTLAPGRYQIKLSYQGRLIERIVNVRSGASGNALNIDF